MKICHVINSLNTGGAERMLCRLLEAMDDRYDNTVVSLMDRGDFAEELEDMGIRVITLGVFCENKPLSALVKLWHEFRRGDYDLVQTWMYHSDLIGGIVARLAGIPVVWGIHNTTLSRQHSSRMTRIIVRMCSLLSYKLPSRIICCSEVSQIVHDRKNYDICKMRIIPNGFDLDNYQPISGAKTVLCRELGIPGESFIIGMVARFDPQKDPEIFLKAVADYSNVNDRAHFVMCGRGFDEGNVQLVGWITDLGINKDKIHLLGIRRDIPELMSALDVLTLSSAYGEAFPLVVGESMACGVPCVVTDVGDSALIVGEAGYVVPVKDPIAIADAWRTHFTQPLYMRESLGRNARQIIVEKYSIEKIAARYQALYEDVINVD